MSEPTPETAEDRAAAQAKEYGKYVAKGVIYIDGARAFNPGNAVPISHVESGLVSADQVTATNTKAAPAAKES